MKRRMLYAMGSTGLLVTLVGLASAGLATKRVSSQGNATPFPELQETLERAQTVSGSNADWEPFVWEFDGVEMVLVPAGCFVMGSTDEQIDYIVNELEGERDWFSDEQPAHRVCFDEPFWIDKYEVSNEQFDTFDGQADRNSYWNDPNQPREQITWYEASDFCAVRDARLPTEAEWEYVARGPDASIYPWGDNFDGNNVVYDTHQTSPVGSKPDGASWVGALDMSGNVNEWLADWFDGNYYGTLDDGVVNPAGSDRGDYDYRVLRGGTWVISSMFTLRSAYRSGIFPAYSYHDIGFRCARSISSTTSDSDTPPLSVTASIEGEQVPTELPPAEDDSVKQP